MISRSSILSNNPTEILVFEKVNICVTKWRPGKSRLLLLWPVSYTPVHQICFLSSKTQLQEGCGQDPCDMFTNQCLGSLICAYNLMPKIELCNPCIEIQHFRSLEEGIFQRVSTLCRIDLCQRFYRFWHYGGFTLPPDVNICQQCYRSWYSAILSCIIIIIIMPICAHSSTDADIR